MTDPTLDPSAPWYRTALHPDTLQVGDLVLAAFPHRFYTEWRLGVVRQLEHLTDAMDRRGVPTPRVDPSQPFVAQIDSSPDTTRAPFSAWFSGADVQLYTPGDFVFVGDERATNLKGATPVPTDEELDAQRAWDSLS